ncbi:uncharacterized protein BYT42DRAFT_491310 [Radiomyces spectabilis]|uniref:uncharacterized protein n=1 Tax=Radiomyces spectabilis TaxID=64574 RepID=UPI0022203F40|nr:uncharacterized protein BYT42DRAFT_491310 [Radiomyces spectabilis]KAI8388666.1 hypothetical protein BYT42DRAFT_491310 [Radiomyces spectabilis]
MDDDDDFQQPRYIRKKKVNPSGRLSPSIDHDMLSPTAASAFQTKDPSKSTSYRIPKIFVCSRTHKQLAQLVGELKGNTTYRPRMTVLGSREQLCIHPKVSKSSNKSEDCFNLLEARECIYGRRVAQLLGDLQISRGVNPIWDIEDLVTLGKKTRGCPYYSARTLYEHAELVFCPYNYIIDPNIRSALDIDLENNIVIIDEAHNIEDAARSAGSFEINEMELKILQLELNQISKRELSADSHGQILFLVDSLLDWMQSPENVHNIKEFDRDVALWDGHQLVPKLSSVGITQSIFHTTLVFAHQAVRRHADEIRKKNESRGTDLDMVYEDDEPFSSQNQKYTVRECVSDYGLRLLSGLFMVLGYIFDKEHAHAKDYRMVLIKRKNRTTKPQNEAGTGDTNSSTLLLDAWVHKLAFWCLNPGIIFRDISEKVHSVILTSGTLSPMDTFARELETDFPIRVEAKHVIDSSQVWVRTLPRGPGQVILSGTFNNVESFAYQDDVGEALLNVVRAVPYGVLCFFPSYRAIDTLVKRWKTTGLYQQLDQQKHVMLEPHQGARNAFDKTLKKFYGHIQKAQEGMFGSGKDGALFLAVYRGKASEGIDFSNNNCRAVVALGIPYPNM